MDAAELSAALRTCECDLLVIDPALREGAFVDELEEMLARNPAVPVVVYTTLAPSAMRLVVRLARVGVQHVVLNRFDDEPRRFLELIERVPTQPLADLMLEELAGSLRSLPIVVARAIDQLFRSPARVRNTQELARMAGMVPRTLYRQLAPVGLQPRHLIICARLVRAYVLLRSPEPRLKEVALKLGYADPSGLSEQLREWTGMAPREIRRSMSAEQFVRSLAGHLRQSHEDDEETVSPAQT